MEVRDYHAPSAPREGCKLIDLQIFTVLRLAPQDDGPKDPSRSAPRALNARTQRRARAARSAGCKLRGVPWFRASVSWITFGTLFLNIFVYGSWPVSPRRTCSKKNLRGVPLGGAQLPHPRTPEAMLTGVAALSASGATREIQRRVNCCLEGKTIPAEFWKFWRSNFVALCPVQHCFGGPGGVVPSRARS